MFFFHTTTLYMCLCARTWTTYMLNRNLHLFQLSECLNEKKIRFMVGWVYVSSCKSNLDQKEKQKTLNGLKFRCESVYSRVANFFFD